MKTRILLLCFFAATFGLRAQQPTPAIESAPLPSGELVKSAPDHSQWTIVTKPSSAAGPKRSASGDDARAAEKAATRRLTITKSGDLRRVVGTNRDGVTAEAWVRGSIQVTVMAGTNTPLIVDAHDGLDSYSTPFISTDFPGLQWATAQNYVGLMKTDSQTWIVFQAKVPMDAPREAEHPLVDAVAYVDLNTRLPAYMRKGTEESVYQFEPAADSPLTLPPTVVAALNAREQRIRQLTQSPARPY